MPAAREPRPRIDQRGNLQLHPDLARRAGDPTRVLLDGDDEPVSIADAPFYRRTVILEFLEQEMKRLQHFDSVFSVLLVNCSLSAPEQHGDNSPTQWLTRLRDCLREVDVIGQLADAVYVLPQTKKRAAEALCQRILAEYTLARLNLMTVIRQLKIGATM